MTTSIEPPYRIKPKGKHYYAICKTLFEIDMKYVSIKPIGRGSYGVVCSSIKKDTNERVAIKKISNIFENSVNSVRTLREMMLLRLIQHENVIALKDVMMPVQRTSFKDVYLVYELMDTDLHKIITSSHPLSNDHCKYFMFQLLRGLKYLHSANILHRDLNQLKLIISVLGTPDESDIEFIENPKARGFIKSLPYTRGIHFSRLFPHADPLAVDLLQKMLVFDPNERITAIEALQHPYMAGLYDPMCNPPSPVPINLNINENWGEEILREVMWSEMLHYHPEAAFVNA